MSDAIDTTEDKQQDRHATAQDKLDVLRGAIDRLEGLANKINGKGSNKETKPQAIHLSLSDFLTELPEQLDRITVDLISALERIEASLF